MLHDELGGVGPSPRPASWPLPRSPSTAPSAWPRHATPAASFFIDTGHDLMMTEPDAVAEILLAIPGSALLAGREGP